MDWAAFSRFCHEHPRYRRGSAADIDTLSGPDTGDPLNRAIAAGQPLRRPGRNILLPGMLAQNAAPDAPFRFELTSREDIIVFLARHHGHERMSHGNGGFCPAWDIKVRGRIDPEGTHDGAEKTDPAFDRAWQAYFEQNSDALWWEACMGALSRFTNGAYSTWSGDDSGSYKFATAGRSGGHLILTDWDGPKAPSGGLLFCPMAFESRDDYIGWLRDLSDTDLARFYKLVASVDHSTREPHTEVSRMLARKRQFMETLWRRGEMLPEGTAPEDNAPGPTAA